MGFSTLQCLRSHGCIRVRLRKAFGNISDIKPGLVDARDLVTLRDLVNDHAHFLLQRKNRVFINEF